MTKRRSIVKWTYLSTLGMLLTWMTSAMTRGVVYQHAEGLVVGDSGAISPEYTVTVLEMRVRNGDEVKRGDVVARVSSSRVAETTANMAAQSSLLVTKMSEITGRSEIIDQLVTSAESRDKVVNSNAAQLEEVRKSKLLPLLTENALVEQIFRGKQELAALRAERDTIGRQVAQIVAASRFTDQAIDDLQVLFDAGRMKAPMDGYIATVEASVGSVVRPGDLVAEMVGAHRYVLAYFPVERLYTLRVGERVTVATGYVSRLPGRITRIEPIAARLPKEFQRTLSPVERHQLVRIDFDEGVTPPPYFTKVVVR